MATAKAELVQIKPIEMVEAKIKIVGDSPLIMHAWDAKAKRQILEKEIGTAKTKSREVKNPVADWAASATTYTVSGRSSSIVSPER